MGQTMAAVLRACGAEFDPDRFCSESGLEPCKLYRRGESMLPATKPEARKHEKSGINIVVSEADFHEFPRQVAEAAAFLECTESSFLNSAAPLVSNPLPSILESHAEMSLSRVIS